MKNVNKMLFMYSYGTVWKPRIELKVKSYKVSVGLVQSDRQANSSTKDNI